MDKQLLHVHFFTCQLVNQDSHYGNGFTNCLENTVHPDQSASWLLTVQCFNQMNLLGSAGQELN